MALTKISGDILKQPLNVGIITATSINVSGISTLGITSATNLTSQSLVVSGISTLGITSATNLTSQSLVVSGISTLGITSTTNLTSQSLVVSGISTFTNGPVLVGTATPTGTASQPLQVTGGAYVSGNLGVGVTNPTAYKVQVAGDIKSSQALHFGTDGTYEAGTIYSDANWGAIIRANTTSPVVADFLFTNSADVHRFRIDTSGNVIIPGNTTATGTASQPLQVTGGAYVSGSVGIGISTPLTKLDVRGVITAGTDATSGSEIIRGYYSGGGSLNVIGSEYSSGGLVLGYSVKPSTSASSAFFSSTGISISRGAYTIAGNEHKWYAGAVQTVAENSSVTMSEVMRIDSSRNLLIGTLSATGTASQPLQVNGGAYVSGNLGVGVTNPAEIFHVNAPSNALAVIRLSGSAVNQTPFIIRQGIVGTNNGGFSIYDVNNSATRFASE